ncbi:phosphotransferase [Vibrio sp. 2-Bac 85]
MDINNKIQTASHSGATLEVLKINERFIVKKTIHTTINRNKLAIKKQQNFIKLMTSSYDILAIPVDSISEEVDNLVIKMPYIEGIGGDAISNKGNKVTANNIKIALNTYLINTLANSEVKIISNKVILKKLEEIEEKTLTNIHHFPSFSEAISIVRKNSATDLTLPIGPCHGDFTLSNMKITQENQLYIFDFLDCFIESPLQDAVKIIQDMVYGWSFRKEKGSLRLKGKLFCESAYPNFINTLEKLYPREMKILEIMMLLRIAPYIDGSDDVTIKWFNTSLCKSLKRLKG